MNLAEKCQSKNHQSSTKRSPWRTSASCPCRETKYAMELTYISAANDATHTRSNAPVTSPVPDAAMSVGEKNASTRYETAN